MGCEPIELKLFPLGRRYLTISSAVYPEGVSWVDRVVLARVDESYDCADPAGWARGVARDGDVVFITAAKRHGFFEPSWGRLFVSAGLGETGVVAGRTINVAAFVNEPLGINGLVNLVITITEAKCGALRDLGLPYTGTASDAVAVGSPGGAGMYAGPATELGRGVAALVREKIREMVGEELSPGPGGR